MKITSKNPIEQFVSNLFFGTTEKAVGKSRVKKPQRHNQYDDSPKHVVASHDGKDPGTPQYGKAWGEYAKLHGPNTKWGREQKLRRRKELDSSSVTEKGEGKFARPGKDKLRGSKAAFKPFYNPKLPIKGGKGRPTFGTKVDADYEKREANYERVQSNIAKDKKYQAALSKVRAGIKDTQVVPRRRNKELDSSLFTEKDITIHPNRDPLKAHMRARNEGRHNRPYRRWMSPGESKDAKLAQAGDKKAAKRIETTLDRERAAGPKGSKGPEQRSPYSPRRRKELDSSLFTEKGKRRNVPTPQPTPDTSNKRWGSDEGPSTMDAVSHYRPLFRDRNIPPSHGAKHLAGKDVLPERVKKWQQTGKRKRKELNGLYYNDGEAAMDITTLSKNELLELLDAVTEKAKKKSGKDDNVYFTNRTSFVPQKTERDGPDRRSRNLSRKRGAKTPRIMAEDESHDRIAREADVRRRRGIPTMTGVRGKELDSSLFTEKGKKKGRGGGDGGPKATGNEPRPSKTFTREAMNRPEGPGNKYSAPQGPDKKGKSMKKSWQWESPMGKMRGKELFESTEKAKKRSAQPPKDDGANRSLSASNAVQRSNEAASFGQNQAYKPDFSKGQRPDERRAREMNKKPPQLPSAGQKTPRVMPGSRVDINKQNRDAAANQKKATLNNRSDFHKMKVNEAKMKRRKELQTEQAIDQYLSYESEMDDNRQLMFEVITEKAKKRSAQPPTPSSEPSRGKPNDLKQEVSEGIARERLRSSRALGSNWGRIFREQDEQRSFALNKKPPQLPSAGQKTPRVMPGSRVDINKQNNASRKKNEAQMKRRKELFEATEKAMKKSVPRPPRPANAQDSAMGRQSLAESNKREAQTEQSRRNRVRQGVERQSHGDEERNRTGRYKADLVMYDDEGKKSLAKRLERYTNPVNQRKLLSGSRLIEKHRPKASKVSKMSGAEVYRASQVDTDAKRRRKELQFDGSLVVGAESFFLQMVAATKPK